MKKIFLFLLITLILSPFFVFAVEYVPLINDLPGVTPGQSKNLEAYLGGLYKLLIGVTIALAFIVITFEGLKHMGSESPFAKSEASRRIGEAIGGIILAVMSWLILFTINPCLVSFNFLNPSPECSGAVAQPTSIQSLNDNDGLINLEFLANEENIGKFCYQTALGLNCFDTVEICLAERSETIQLFPTSTVGPCSELIE